MISVPFNDEETATVVTLDREMGIQQAADFYQAVLPLAGLGAPVRVDAAAVRSIHTSILQIVYALSQAVPDFAVTEASEEFRAAEVRVGFFLARRTETNATAQQS